MNIGRGLPGSATADPGQDREHDTTDNNVNTSTRTGTSGTSTVKNAVRGIRSFFSRAHNAGKYYLPWVFDRRPLPLESGSPPLIDINTPDTLYKTVDGKYFSFVRDEEMEAEAPEYNNRPIPSFNDVMLSPLVPSSSRDYMAMVHQRSKGEIPNADTHWYGFLRGHILYDKDMSRSELIKLSDALTILEAHPGMVDQDMSQMLKEKKRAFVIKRNERLPELYEKDQLSVGVPPLIPVDLMKGAVSDSVLEYCDGGGKPGFGANSKLLFLIASGHARFNPATGLMEFCERKDESKYRSRKSAIKPRYIKITKPDPNPENIKSRKLKSFLERNYLMCCGAGYACGIVGGGFSAFVLDWFSNEEQLTNRRLRMNAAMNAASKVGSRCGISLAFLAMGFEFVSRDMGLVLPDNREWNHKYGYATAVGTTMAIFQLRVGPRAAVVGGIISFGATVLATKLRDWYLVRRMENHPVIRRVAKMIKDADPVKMQEAVEKAKQYKNPLFVTRPHIDPFPTKAHA